MSLAGFCCSQVVGQCCEHAGPLTCCVAACRIMREYMPKVGTMGHDMMFRSTTIQVGRQDRRSWCLLHVLGDGSKVMVLKSPWAQPGSAGQQCCTCMEACITF